MALTRRAFLGGAVSLGAFAGTLADGGARLTFGVVSDIHVDVGRGDFGKFGDTAPFEKALRWFDANGADGVVLAGDMADNGMTSQLDCVGAAWFRVFPDGRSSRDGRPVEQLFVYGNHDLDGHRRANSDGGSFLRPSYEKALVRTDPAAAWEHAFREKYAPVWLKEVRGYKFVGAHWTARPHARNGLPEIEPWFREHAGALAGAKPFFFIQHVRAKDAAGDAGACCAEKDDAARALAAFPNAVAFSGCGHRSLADAQSLRRGAFISIGTSSLRYGRPDERRNQREGMLVTVFDDRLVVARRDFRNDRPLGDDWVIPLGKSTQS